MSKLKIQRGEWVVVCDGKKALILENVGDSKFPNLHTREVREHEDPRTSEQGSDQPGRFFQSVDGRRSAAEQTDWHDRSERAFLDKLVADLGSAVLAGAPKGITVVAPPRALGMIREAYSPAMRDAIKAEIAHDYVKLPVDEIERRLTS
jgi:protein required for attachment to host cells